MWKIVHLIDSVCRILLNVCHSICDIFMCPVHKKGDNRE